MLGEVAQIPLKPHRQDAMAAKEKKSLTAKDARGARQGAIVNSIPN
jgi:hypothetical protein